MSEIMDIKKYAEEMLLNVADELNVKEVILKKDGVYATYRYDTLTGKSIGFSNGEEAMVALLFTGNVIEDMRRVRQIIKDGLNERAQAKIKVRQPLQSITINV